MEGDRPPNPRNGDKLETERLIKKLLRRKKLEKVWFSYVVLINAIIVPLTPNFLTHRNFNLSFF